VIRRIAATLAAVAAVILAGAPGGAQSAPDVAWVQWEADGQPHARAIVHGAACPDLVAGKTIVRMALRAAPSPGFADRVCDAPLPPNAAHARAGGMRLPAIPRAPRRIALFGDTGCRLKGTDVQACNDATAWPFPTIAADVAAAQPDLVIHVGDYYYRESPCPRGLDCTNSPHGDNSDSWMADYFVPMRPVFAVAPLVNVRGNHETCDRGGIGWSRYLSGLPAVACVPHEPPAFAAFDDLLVGDVDDATEVTETMGNPPVWTADLALVEARAALTARRETWLISHRPAVTYLFTHERSAPAGNIAAFFSGHIHLFGAYGFTGEAPQLIVGMGGDNLASDAETQMLAILGGTTERRFGYALADRYGDAWAIKVHDADRTLHRRCRLAERGVACGESLSGTP
jgi:hypothetical protein